MQGYVPFVNRPNRLAFMVGSNLLVGLIQSIRCNLRPFIKGPMVHLEGPFLSSKST